MHWPSLPPTGNIPGTHFCYRPSQPQRYSVAGRIMSMKNSTVTIGNGTHDLPAGSQCLNHATTESKDRNSFLSVSKHNWHNANFRKACNHTIKSVDIPCNEFHPDWTKSVESAGKISFMSRCNAWPALHWYSRNSQLFNDTQCGSCRPNFIQSCEEIWKVGAYVHLRT